MLEKAVQMHSVYDEFYNDRYGYEESRNDEYHMTEEY